MFMCTKHGKFLIGIDSTAQLFHFQEVEAVVLQMLQRFLHQSHLDQIKLALFTLRTIEDP